MDNDTIIVQLHLNMWQSELLRKKKKKKKEI